MNVAPDARSITAMSGRRAERDAIVAELDASSAGARCVLVSGEPGIGKSWLLRAVRQLAADRGARVLEGYAIELPGAPPAYPLDRAFAPALRERLPRELAAAQAILADAGVGTAPRNASAPAPMTADGSRLRAFQALADLCAWLAGSQPIVVALDDMQWAQPFTWEALQYAVRALGSAPVLFVLAAREELLLRQGDESVPALGELLRLRLLRHVTLRPLANAAIASLASQLLDARVGPELASFIAQRSEGNPFFAEEVLNDCRERGLLVERDGEWELSEAHATETTDLPLTLRLAIGARLDRLPGDCDRALAAAAILGRTFTTHDVAGATGADSAAVSSALRAAAVAGFIETIPSGWRFRHDTIRETLIERHRDEAPRLHAAVASVLAQGAGYAPSVETLAALAHHWLAAGEPLKAAPAALHAARAALASHAPLEALALARTGRRASEHANSGRDAHAAFEARLVHGEIALAAAAYAEAGDALRTALQATAGSGEPALEGRAWLRLGTVHRRQELAQEALAAYGRAIALLDETANAALLAEALTAWCDIEGLTRAHYEEARSAGERALAVASRLGDRGLEARAILALANVETRAVDPLAARSLQLRALEHALAANDPALAAEVCGSLANSFYWTGEIRESQRYALQRLELAERAGDVFGLRHAHSWLALLAVTRGDWDEARSLIATAEDALTRLDSPEPLAFVHVVEAFLSLRLGDAATAAEQLRTAIAVLERVDPGTVIWYAGLLAIACVRIGATDEARAVAAAQEARLSALTDSALPARSARAALGHVYAALGDVAAGAACESALRPYAADFHWSPAHLSLAALASLRGDASTALADLAASETRTRAEELHPDLALTLLARAALLPRRDARPVLEEAAALIESLGMRDELERVERLRHPSDAAAPGGLSPRELEVLALIAQGRTNREIAAALVISERTAINHVSHIFDKLGVENRAGATAFALRHDLA